MAPAFEHAEARRAWDLVEGRRRALIEKDPWFISTVAGNEFGLKNRVRATGRILSIQVWIFAKNFPATGSSVRDIESTCGRSVIMARLITAWSWPAWSIRCGRPSRRRMVCRWLPSTTGRSSGTSCSPAVCSMLPAALVEVQVLSPLAVMPEHQKRGIGSALVRHGLKALAEQSVPLVFLEGDPRYYARFGFAPGDDQGFRKPSLRIPDGGFQAIKLCGV